MRELQVETGFQEAVALQKKLIVVLRQFIEITLDKPFFEFNRQDMFALRSKMTRENVEHFLSEHQTMWQPVYETLKDVEEDETILFTQIIKNINVHLHQLNDEMFIQFDYSKTIGRWWNVLSENSRGILYSYPQMEIISLPFHKFYNLDERYDTQLSTLNLNQPTYAMEKLDGSMIHVFESENQLYASTRGAIQGFDINRTAKNLVEEQLDVNETLSLIRQGYTPIFELLLTKENPNALVVVYEKEELRLIAVRNKNTGHYIHPLELENVASTLGVKSAEIYQNKGLQAILEERESIQNMEGWVVYFEDGTFIKIKGEEYLSLMRPKGIVERIKKSPASLGKIVFDLMQENQLDDVLANIRDKEVREAMEKMEERITRIINGWEAEAMSILHRHEDKPRAEFGRAVTAEPVEPIVVNMTFGMYTKKNTRMKLEYFGNLLTIE